MVIWSYQRKLAAVAAAGIAAVSIAACGGNPAGNSASGSSGGSAAGSGGTAQPAAQTSAALHACKLLTAAQASAIVGVHYTSATESTAGAMCSYATNSAPIPMFILISKGATAADWKQELGTMEEDAGSAPVTLTGAGEKAAGCGTEIGVEADGYIIDVHGGDPLTTGSGYPKSIAVAKAIITGLK
jgi:uncharacterized protein DUF3558